MQIEPRGPGRVGAQAGQPGQRRALCIIVLAILVTLGAAAPVAASVPPPPVVRIPGDYPLPDPGARVVVPVPPGGQIRLDPAALDPAEMIPSLAGPDLVLRFADGGTLVLRDFFASVDPPASIALGDTVVSAQTLLAQIEALRDAESLVDVAAGPAAGGGGEMFGLLQVVSWLVDRIDPIPAAEAGQVQQLAQAGDPASFAQLAAQLKIARDLELASHAAAYQLVTARILASVRGWLEGGGGNEADVLLAQGFDLDAQIQKKDATHQLVLSIDAHQDAFGERLESAAFPAWDTPPPDDLSAISAALPAEQQAAARRHWRQAQHARDTVAQLETLVVVADELRSAFEQQFEVAQRSLSEVENAHRTAFQARMRLTERRADQLIAEAWLLAALGELPAHHIKHPGWQ